MHTYKILYTWKFVFYNFISIEEIVKQYTAAVITNRTGEIQQGEIGVWL